MRALPIRCGGLRGNQQTKLSTIFVDTKFSTKFRSTAYYVLECVHTDVYKYSCMLNLVLLNLVDTCHGSCKHGSCELNLVGTVSLHILTAGAAS
jgi:hypothetical protein